MIYTRVHISAFRKRCRPNSVAEGAKRSLHDKSFDRFEVCMLLCTFSFCRVRYYIQQNFTTEILKILILICYYISVCPIYSINTNTQCFVH